MAIALKVSPEELKAQAANFEAEVSKIKTALNQIDGYVKGTKKYWQGDASDAHIQKYLEAVTSVGAVIKKLEKDPKDLLQITGIYESTEEENSQVAMELPSDVIK